MKGCLICLVLLITSGTAHGVPPTVADPSYDTSISDPCYAPGTGPRVLVDAAHQNFHRADGRYQPAAEVLRNDGYRVRSSEPTLSSKHLEEIDVLIVASAVGDMNPNLPQKWRKPVPSAFTTDEIEMIANWVHAGGGLLLIVDYMPVAGMSAKLAAAFGVELADGYAYDRNDNNKLAFSRVNKGLADHVILNKIDAVTTFAGTAMRLPDHGQPLLLFGNGSYLLEPVEIPLPDTPPPPTSPRRNIDGWVQAGAIQFGNGRVVVFGEAAVFSAQRYPNGVVMGMNHPAATGNKRLLRNVIGWLADGS